MLAVTSQLIVYLFCTMQTLRTFPKDVVFLFDNHQLLNIVTCLQEKILPECNFSCRIKI